MRSGNLLSGTFVGLFLLLMAPSNAPAHSGELITEGRLDAIGAKGEPLGNCPLKHTDVTVDISGFIARVTVRQQFQNPFKDKIEAIYVFPLSQDAAVNEMTMKVGRRLIKGEIKEREEARKIYEQAKARGQVASLLDQERPNIFTQSVANIEPGAQVDITISYSETLEWKDAEYSFDLPMVVGPRYIPGGGSALAPLTKGRPTPQVPDADRITPPVTPEGTRAGHDVSVTVNLNAGLPLRRIDSKQHEITVEYTKDDRSQAIIKLKRAKIIPNRDFVLVYETASEKIEDTILTHTDKRGKFFTLVLQPPKRVRKQSIVPKEIVFVIDKSGSMQGFPIDTAKEAMRLCIEGLHENDTFNLMTFAGGVGFCFDKPVPNTDENRAKALAYLGHLQGSGGTEMLPAIHACLARQDDPERVRVVCFMTDGYVGNEMVIIDAVKKTSGVARVFSFGIGSSVNRYLLDGIAKAGRGEVHYIFDASQAKGAGERFFERVRTPVLTDVELDFGELTVTELYPKAIPDLFSSKPVVVTGQYKEGGKATITLRGKTGEGKFERKIDVTLPDARPDNKVLASLWARAKVDHLMGEQLSAIQHGRPDPAVKEEILGLGIRFQLLTQFTSFVAVEELKITEGGVPRTVEVPVEMPRGVSYQGVFGNADDVHAARPQFSQSVMKAAVSGASSDLGGIARSGLGGRTASGRSAAVRRRGGGAATESAVVAALKWLAAQQNADGSWSWNHAPGDVRGGDTNPEDKKSKMGATGIALLPFLGAGYTHQDGKYKETVRKGLKYLVGNMIVANNAGKLFEKDGADREHMYSHGIAACALTEAFGMTNDYSLQAPAQLALNYIVQAQHAENGGWRDAPQSGGDTSVVGWQVLALKSGILSHLNVPGKVKPLANKWLDSVQSELPAGGSGIGSRYGQLAPGDRDSASACTAIGLLCRVYLGTKREDPGLQMGIRSIAVKGPIPNDMDYNYHATALMYQADGPRGEMWKQWNKKMRDHLVNTQVKQGEKRGSWSFHDGDGHSADSCLYCTALAAMTLEVYYNYTSVYQQGVVEKDDFPLE